MNRKKLGSDTAKGGFHNEVGICDKFNNWQEDNEAREWLEIMGYNFKKINSVEAIRIPVRISKKNMNQFNIDEEEYNDFIRYKKADAQIRILIKICDIIKIENLSLKKANRNANIIKSIKERLTHIKICGITVVRLLYG